MRTDRVHIQDSGDLQKVLTTARLVPVYVIIPMYPTPDYRGRQKVNSAHLIYNDSNELQRVELELYA